MFGGMSGGEATRTPARECPVSAGLESGTFPKGAWSLPPSTACLL